jgi:serine/threonine protein kinase
MDASLSQRPLDFYSKLRYCLDIAAGMRFLHQSNVIHRDLKSVKLLIDDKGRCKIADFGLRTIKTTIASLFRSRPAWTAPDVLIESKHSFSSDMYSFGVIIWEIFTEEIPWNGKVTTFWIKVTAPLVANNLPLTVTRALQEVGQNVTVWPAPQPINRSPTLLIESRGIDRFVICWNLSLFVTVGPASQIPHPTFN